MAPQRQQQSKVYAVAKGYQPGIYFDWITTEAQVCGFPNATFKSFPSMAMAERYLKEYHLIPANGQNDDNHNGNNVSGGWITRSREPIPYQLQVPNGALATSASATTTTSSSSSKNKYNKKRSIASPLVEEFMDFSNSTHYHHQQKQTRMATSTTTTTAAATASLFTLTPTSPFSKNTSMAIISPDNIMGAASPTTPNSNNIPNGNSFHENHNDNHDTKPTAEDHEVEVEGNVIVVIDDDDDDDDCMDNDLDSDNNEFIALEPNAKVASLLPPSPTLDVHQQRAVDAAMKGSNVFLTGVAGTGKSLVTQLLYQHAVERYGKDSVGLAAPTGMAAVALGKNSQTIHTLFGIKVPQRASDFASMHHRNQAKKIRSLQCLILDEVGMISADFMDWLDYNVRTIRHKPLEVMGGMQLIFVGDFAQLGPVPGSSWRLSSQQRPPYQPIEVGADGLLQIRECTAFLFQSVLWRQAKFVHVQLQKVYRQEQDVAFIHALMDLREQRPNTPQVQNLIQKCSKPLTSREEWKMAPPGILPTFLYTTNRNADRENAERLAALPTMGKTFVAIDSVQVDSEINPAAAIHVHQQLQRNKFFEQCQAVSHLELKVGAQVMLIQNTASGRRGGTDMALVNGSRGVVVGFQLCPVVRDVSTGKLERLITPHEEDQDKLPPGLCFFQLKFGNTLEFENTTWKIFKFVKYPLVQFLSARNPVCITPVTLERTLLRQGTCRRYQLPLRLSWALTIHKAQGCTLDYVICDLAGCFTSGQAYVALSRAKNMAGLEIQHYKPSTVVTDPLVTAFYQAMQQQQQQDQNCMESFLEDQAGLWFYPLLDHPKWLEMFEHASGTVTSQKNAEQFRHWVADYRPDPKTYQGWKGYSS